jgi:hypothetical protein
MSDFEVIDASLLLDDALEQLAESRDVPLVVAKLEDRAIHGLRGCDVEGGIKRRVGDYDVEIGVQNQNGFAGGFDEGVGIGAGLFEDALERVDVLEAASGSALADDGKDFI